MLSEKTWAVIDCQINKEWVYCLGNGKKNALFLYEFITGLTKNEIDERLRDGRIRVAKVEINEIRFFHRKPR